MLLPDLHLHRQVAIAVDHEAGPVEHQFILPANAVDIGQRQATFGGAALGHAIDPQRVLVDLVGAAVGAQQNFRAAPGKVAANRRVPYILADRHPQQHPAKGHRLGQGSGVKQPHLVKGAVVWQFVLVAQRGHLAAIEQRHAVIEHPVGGKDAADQHRRAAIGGGLGQQFQLHGGAFDQRGLQHQVFGRIADQAQFGENHQVGPGGGGAPACGQHRGGVGGKVANRLVELGKRDLEAVWHAASLGTYGRAGNMLAGGKHPG